jgi:peptidoglycan glycosyltransferase
VYNLDPALTNFSFPRAVFAAFPDTDKVLHNDGNQACGGTMADDMFAQSCDPGYGKLGVQIGAPTLARQAALFGYNSRPPIDLPSSWVGTPVFPPASDLDSVPEEEDLADSAIGQFDDEASALSDAMVAAGIANGGAIMTPHVMAQIRNGQGDVVTTYQPTVWKQAVSAGAAAQVTSLMQQVVTEGTASQVGFPPALDAAVKTGTAQVGNSLQGETDDWMIGFAPASHPTVAVAVVVPLQAFNGTGAGVAGPIMKEMLDAALLP